MTMPTLPAISQGRAACADRLDLVDASMQVGGRWADRVLKEDYCPRCRIAESCFLNGMAGEAGVWGGTTQRERNSAGKKLPRARRARKARSATSRPPNRAEQRVAELGTTEATVRAWALERGLCGIRGRISLAVIEQWATAHAPDEVA